MNRIETTFTSDGLALAADLYVRDDLSSPAPAIVFTGPFTGVKGQVTGHYARRIAEAGFVTLAFDHRNFGASEGEPRQHEDATGKLADLRDAVSHLASRPEVDAERIGVCGICLGGGYALRFAGFDPRVKAAVLVAGGYNSPYKMREGMGEEGYRSQMANFAAVAQEQHRTGEVAYMAAVAPEGEPAAMGGQEPFDYYGTERGAAPGWENRVTTLSIHELLTFDALCGADFISPTPALIVHGRTDAYCAPSLAQEAHDRMAGPKEIVWLDTTNHIDLYDVETYVGPAVEHATAWFSEHLGA